MTHIPVSLPTGLTARGATMEDVDTVVTVIQAAERLDDGRVTTVRDDIVSDWRRPSMDITTDVLLVEAAGRVVACAEQFRGRAFANVHPDVRGRGIGSAIAAWTEEHARAAGLEQVGQTLASTATSAWALLTARGYVPRWESWILRYPLDATPPRPTFPADITIRSVRRPEDDRALHDLIEEAFSVWSDRDSPMSFEDWCVSYLDRANDALDLVLLAEDQDRRLVGAAVCAVESGEGWIDQLAVARDRQGAGIGGALLRTAFWRFHERGLFGAALSTDSRTGALDLYRHVGMEVTDQFTRLTLRLT